MRIAVLANGMTGYLDACFRALTDRGVELLIVYPESVVNTDYDGLPIARTARMHPWTDDPSPAELNRLIDDFDPDAILMHSWDFLPYRAVVRGRTGTVRVLWIDNNWLATAKQWLGRATHRIYLSPLFDAVLVPSDRTEFFARRLGFGPSDCIRGSLSADTELYGAEPVDGDELVARHRFCAVLRMVHHKGADVLADAYRQYRTLTDDPWDLDLVGIGPMLGAFDGILGVNRHGFLQPAEVAGVLHRSSCLVNPSRLEPYAVVLHEAAAAALPMLSTDFVAAHVTMVQDGYNGWVVQNSRPDLLAGAMARMSSLDAERLGEMSRTSRLISQRLSPAGWARNLEEEIARRRG
ncbi:MAG: glycosyltransferase family 4 protein [Marmoricola sp.]